MTLCWSCWGWVLRGFPGERSVFRNYFLAASVFFVSGVAVFAQDMPIDVIKDLSGGKDGSTYLGAGDESRSDGLLDLAGVHFSRHLRVHPFDRATLAKLLACSVGDPDEQALRSLNYALCVMDERGQVKLDRKAKSYFPKKDKAWSALAMKRASALRDLERFVSSEVVRLKKKEGSSRLLAEWAATLAWELMRQSPALIRHYGPVFNNFLQPEVDLHVRVLDDLNELLSISLRDGDQRLALRAARCLHGLSTQAAYADLQGQTAPDLREIKLESSRRLRELRDLFAETEEPMTVAELSSLSLEEREAFTIKHRNFGDPGLAVSPGKRYRIESDCGFETLLGVATRIEGYHDRLARWTGKDPFLDEQGVVRLVPDGCGLTAEGAPFFWSGGFQRGHETTLRFSAGTLEGLGRTLTHELTHRFDGTLFNGLPAWLLEGRAEWTEAAYRDESEATFVDNHVVPSVMQNALYKGYGSLAKLEALIDGSVEEYRDNYVAGYALFTYLRTWQVDGVKLFQERLDRYQNEMNRDRRYAVDWFLENFADGEADRPFGLGDFTDGFGVFLRGFDRRTPAPWRSRYEESNAAGPERSWVYDPRTWTTSNRQSEPAFGEDHARVAGDLFKEVGNIEAAVNCYLWSLGVDPCSPRISDLLARYLPELSRSRLGWLVRQSLGEVESEAPFFSALPNLSRLLEAHKVAVKDYEKKGLKKASLALVADHNRIARWTGSTPLPWAVSPGKNEKELVLEDEPPRAFSVYGLTGGDLADHESSRADRFFYETPEGDIHVGRKRSAGSTGGMDRTSYGRSVLVLSKEWIPAGSYRLETEVFFTTSYVVGDVILGYQRKDWNYRFHFSAGDFLYAAGEKDDAPRFSSISWAIEGRTIRGGNLPGAHARGTVKFPRTKPSFKLRIDVMGPQIVVWIDGKRVGSFRTWNASPIQGYPGLFVSWGAARFREPTIQRIDRSWAAKVAAGDGVGISLKEDETLRLHQLVNTPFPELPAHPGGTVVIWVPRFSREDGALDVERVEDRARKYGQSTIASIRTKGLPQPVAMVLPHGVPSSMTQALATNFAEISGSPVRMLTHRRSSFLISSENPDRPARPRPAVLYVDALGCLRVGEVLRRGAGHLPGWFERWARVHRLDARASEE